MGKYGAGPYEQGPNIASAAALPIGAGTYFVVTGTVTITSLGTRPAGDEITLQFSGALILTYNATTLILRGAVNYTTVAGDIITLVSEGSGNWREIARAAATVPVNSMAFPATQVASADANTQDDYEEGSWTPALQFGGAAVGMTFSDQAGRYTKVGNLVHAAGRLVLSAKGSSVGAAKLTGLPFTSANISAYYIPAALYLNGVSFADYPTAVLTLNDTKLSLAENTNAGVETDLAETDFANTSVVSVTVVYRV